MQVFLNLFCSRHTISIFCAKLKIYFAQNFSIFKYFCTILNIFVKNLAKHRLRNTVLCNRVRRQWKGEKFQGSPLHSLRIGPKSPFHTAAAVQRRVIKLATQRLTVEGKDEKAARWRRDKFNAFSTEANQLLHKTGNPREAPLFRAKENSSKGKWKMENFAFSLPALGEMAKVA